MPKKLLTPAPLYPWDGGFDLDDLAHLTHKAHHPDLYRAAFSTEKGEYSVPKAFAKPSVAFKQKRNPHFTFIDLFLNTLAEIRMSLQAKESRSYCKHLNIASVRCAKKL